MQPVARWRGYGLQLLISQFRGVLHKPPIGIIPDPFPPFVAHKGNLHDVIMGMKPEI